MEKEEFQKHFELEESFWWFRGRRDIIKRLLLSSGFTSKKLDILDAGCGTGYNLLSFEEFGTAFGCDFSEDALRFCRKRGLRKIIRADAGLLPLKDQRFDLVALLDVIYHKDVRSDIDVLKEVHRILRDNGRLLITDSAFNFLFSRHDIAFQARERYRKKTLRERLEAAGFSVVKASYFNFFLFGLVVIMRRLVDPLRPKSSKSLSDLKPVPPTLNSLFHLCLKLEAYLIPHLSLPFGSSLLCLAKKK